MDVELIRWPDDTSRLDWARRVGAPRLLLVAAGESPPVTPDPLEDWIRVPVDRADVRARAEVLSLRAAFDAAPPRLDDGVVRHRGRTVALSATESELMAVLLGHLGVVVARERLVAAAWPAGVSGRNTVDVAIGRLRRRLAAIGLLLKTVRSRGYLLEMPEEAGGMSETGQPTVRHT